MKIDKIEINAYGKLENKEIKLKDGINLIIGKNESGKSTLLNYIISMFFGVSKLKENKEISDYDKFKPWSGKEFSGTINYTLDNGKQIEVFRDFSGKGTKIYNENSEDISKDFEISKKEGNKFFTEQTGLTKDMYISSIISTQGDVRLDQESQNSIIQKIANLASSGEDNVSYSKAAKKLKEKLNEEVGTNKTKNKPINLISQEQDEINESLKEIYPYEEKKYIIDEYIKSSENEVKKYEEQGLFLDNIKESVEAGNNLVSQKNIDEEKLKKQEIQKTDLVYRNNKLEEENKEKSDEIQELKNKQKGIELKEEAKNKALIYIMIATSIIIFIITTIIFFSVNINVVKIISGIFILVSVALGIFSIMKYIKNKKIEEENRKKEKELTRIANQINEITTGMNETLAYKGKIEGQIELLDGDIISLKNNLSTYDEQIVDNKKQKDKIINLFEGKIDKDYIDQMLKIKDVDIEIKNNNENLLESKNQKNRLEIESEEIGRKVEEKIKLEERLKAIKEEKDLLLEKEEEINLANKYLEEAYNEMKTRITPKFTENLSYNISKISNNKYNKVQLNDEKGLMIKKDNGDYIDLNSLSVGTVDELYLSLRLSMLEEISKEKMPVMLDETFAYFDNERLENTIKYLANEVKNHQIIIFTCTDREKEILEKLNMKYNKVEL